MPPVGPTPSGDALKAILAHLQNGPTRYEVALCQPDGRRILICYTARRSLLGVQRAFLDNLDLLRTVAGPQLVAGTTARPWPRVTLSNGAWIGLSGRTQRDALLTGLLPRLATVATETTR